LNHDKLHLNLIFIIQEFCFLPLLVITHFTATPTCYKVYPPHIHQVKYTGTELIQTRPEGCVSLATCIVNAKPEQPRMTPCTARSFITSQTPNSALQPSDKTSTCSRSVKGFVLSNPSLSADNPFPHTQP